VQLGVEGGGRIGGRDEAVALLADVGIRAGAGGSVPSAMAGGEPGLDHLGMQPLDPVRDRRSWRHRNQRKGLPRSDLVHRLLVGGADGRGGQPGVAQRHLRGDVAHQGHQRRQPDSAVDQARAKSMPEPRRAGSAGDADGRARRTGRDRKTLAKFFDALGETRCAAITHVSADAATWIANEVADKCPTAVRCADPFHIVAVRHEAHHAGQRRCGRVDRDRRRRSLPERRAVPGPVSYRGRAP